MDLIFKPIHFEGMLGVSIVFGRWAGGSHMATEPPDP